MKAVGTRSSNSITGVYRVNTFIICQEKQTMNRTHLKYCVNTFKRLKPPLMTDLCRGEGGAHAADSLGICLRLLLDLQKLCSLHQRLQSLPGTTVCQLPLRQPLLQLHNIVPEARAMNGIYIQIIQDIVM